MLRRSRSVDGRIANGRISPAGVIVVAAVTLGGCSADVGRFDFSSVGPSNPGSRTATASVPVPSEPLRRNVGAPTEPADLAPAQGFDRRPQPYGGSLPPEREPQVRMSSLPEPAPREPAGRPLPPAPRNAAPAAPAGSKTAARPLSGPTSQPGETIEVQPGDTLYGLSKKHRVPISELMALNQLQSPAIKPGQKLALPAGKRSVARTSTQPAGATPAAPALPAAAPPPAPVAAAPAPADWSGSHTVAAGESLYGIARKHGVKTAALQSANGITDPTKIRPGTVLKVPSGGAAPAQPVAAAPPRQPAALPAAPAQAGGAQPTIINAQQPGGETRVAALPTGGPPTQTDASPAPRAEPASAIPEPPKATSASKFRWPVKGKVISGYGPRPDNTHNDGINISVPLGTEVHAAENGVVAYAGNELKGYGNLVLIRHDGNWVSAYAHNDSLVVKRGDKVKRGQIIAKAGATGTVDQPQVHFELRQGSKPIDPMPHMERN